MVINGLFVSYTFGPEYDLDIRFSASFQGLAGCTYDMCTEYAKLTFQLLCHAVHQIQYTEKKRQDPGNDTIHQGKCEKGTQWRLEKIEEIENWEYPAPETGETIEKAILKSPVLVKHQMTLAKYQIKVKERLVLTIRECDECDFVIDYFDPENDEWIDSILDYAQKHCERFGRI